jgi:hypothetical protein
MGTDSTNSAIAYGGGRSLIVWEAEQIDEEQVAGRTFSTRSVIMGRFVNGASAVQGNAFQISDSEQERGRETRPDVAYDSSRNRFFVVWESTDFPDDRGSPEVIRAATVSQQAAVTPSILLTPDDRGLHDPATAYSPAGDDFLVSWNTDDGFVQIREVDAGSLALKGTEPQDITSEFNIYNNRDDTMSDVAWDAAAGRWLVVWAAQQFIKCEKCGPFRGADFDPTSEIYARSFDGNLGGSDLLRVPPVLDFPEDFQHGTREPAVAADEKGGGFLVVYAGGPAFNSTRGFFDDRRSEIFARRVNADATHGGDELQVSDPNADDEENPRGSRRPDVWHDPNADQFLVTWGQDIAPVEEDPSRQDRVLQYEIFGKKVDGTGKGLEKDTQISNHNPNAENVNEFDGDLPAVTYDRTTCDYVVSWTGEEVADSSDEKEEIWNRPYDAPACPAVTQTAAQSRAPVLCASVRNFPIHLVTRRGRDYEVVLVKVNGKPVQVQYGDRIRAQVNLIGLPIGRFSVEIEATLASGQKMTGVRRYYTCTKRLPPSNGLEREDAL